MLSGRHCQAEGAEAIHGLESKIRRGWFLVFVCGIYSTQISPLVFRGARCRRLDARTIEDGGDQGWSGGTGNLPEHGEVTCLAFRAPNRRLLVVIWSFPVWQTIRKWKIQRKKQEQEKKERIKKNETIKRTILLARRDRECSFSFFPIFTRNVTLKADQKKGSSGIPKRRYERRIISVCL